MCVTGEEPESKGAEAGTARGDAEEEHAVGKRRGSVCGLECPQRYKTGKRIVRRSRWAAW